MSELRALGLCRRCISLYRHARGSGRAVTGQPGSILQNLSQRQAAFILSPVVPLTVSLQAKFDSDSDGSGECHWIGFHSFCPRLKSDCTATDILTLPRLKKRGSTCSSFSGACLDSVYVFGLPDGRERRNFNFIQCLCKSIRSSPDSRQ